MDFRKKDSVTIKHDVSFGRKETIFQCFTFNTICYFTARKTIFSFSRRPEKMVFPKKLRWDMICLVLLGKMIFLFPEKMILPPARKNTRYSLQMFWKDGLFKKDCTGAWSFLYHLRRWFFFPPKTRYFFVGRKTTGWSFSRNTRKHDIFYLTCSTAPCQKHQRWSYPAKIHLNVFDALDRHSRKGSNNSLYFHGDLYRRFHILLSSQKKKTEKLIYTTFLSLLLQFIRLEIFYNE